MDIAELKKLESQATPGPWKADWSRNEEDPIFASFGPIHECKDEDGCDGNCDRSDCPMAKAAKQDAKLLATLRNLAPELIALAKTSQDLIRDCGESMTWPQAREAHTQAFIVLEKKLQNNRTEKGDEMDELAKIADELSDLIT